MKVAVACMSGAFKCVFVQGVLSAFEENNFSAEAYAACSSSALPAAFASFGRMKELSHEVWIENNRQLKQPGNGMSEIVKNSIDKFKTSILENLFSNDSRRFLVPCSYVKNEEAAKITQGDRASMLGRKLLLLAARKDNSWANENLALHVFDTNPEDSEYLISEENFEEVFYATTRMLHAWRIPAFIGGRPYIDGSYTCTCPVEPLIETGYKNIIAIATEPGEIYNDLFSTKKITPEMQGCKVEIIQPETDLKNYGVEYTRAADEGLRSVYEYGIKKGNEFLSGN